MQDPAAQALFERISTAYETLVDPERRRRYDAADAHFDDPEAHSLEFSGFDFTVAALGSQAATFTELFADVLHPLPREDRHRQLGQMLDREIIDFRALEEPPRRADPITEKASAVGDAKCARHPPMIGSGPAQPKHTPAAQACIGSPSRRERR